MNSFVAVLEGAKGRVEVEMLDRNGQPVPGYTRADCVPITAASIRHPVRWRDTDDLLRAAGAVGDLNDRTRALREPVRFKFYLTDAKLYSFSIE